MKNILLIGLGGFLGAVARFVVSSTVANKYFSNFPWGTLVVNITGCFILGFFMSIFIQKNLAVELRLFIAVGFVGAYTTFSTFGYETLQLLQDGNFHSVLGNLFLSNGLGLLALWLGDTLGNLM